MPLSIKHPEADRLARELAEQTGESLTEAVIAALRERLARARGRLTAPKIEEQLMEIGRRCAALPDLDERPADAILGYDEHGLPR